MRSLGRLTSTSAVPPKRQQVSRGTGIKRRPSKTLPQETHLVNSSRQSARNGRRQDAILSRVVQAFEKGKLGRVGDGRRRERVDQLDDDVRVAFGVPSGVCVRRASKG